MTTFEMPTAESELELLRHLAVIMVRTMVATVDTSVGCLLTHEDEADIRCALLRLRAWKQMRAVDDDGSPVQSAGPEV